MRPATPGCCMLGCRHKAEYIAKHLTSTDARIFAFCSEHTEEIINRIIAKTEDWSYPQKIVSEEPL